MFESTESFVELARVSLNGQTFIKYTFILLTTKICISVKFLLIQLILALIVVESMGDILWTFLKLTLMVF